MNSSIDTQTFSSELVMQHRSMVAMYYYDLHSNLGGYPGENLPETSLENGLEQLKQYKIALDTHSGPVFLTRKSTRLPISGRNIGFTTEYKTDCIIPEDVVVVRFMDVLLTTEEVAIIFNVEHEFILGCCRSLQSDLEIFNFLLKRSGVKPI